MLAAGDSRSTLAAGALEELCRTYWYPLYAFLRRQGNSPENAQDLVQGFLAHLLRNERLAQVAPEKGRFRSFLLASLKNVARDQADKANALKRGGGEETVSFDAATAEERFALEPSDLNDPARVFERRWAMTLLERTLTRLEQENTAGPRRAKFEGLRSFLLGDPTDQTYAEIGRQLGLSEGAVKVAVLRLRQRYRELFRDEIANTVASEAEIEDELRHVFTVLAG